MDILCRVCGEPWENDSLHDEAEASGRTYTEVLHDFQSRGCLAFTTYGAQHSENRPESAEIAGALYDLLGDDLDAAAVLLDDYHLT